MAHRRAGVRCHYPQGTDQSGDGLLIFLRKHAQFLQLRAPPPSAAAELDVYDIRQLEEGLEEFGFTLERGPVSLIVFCSSAMDSISVSSARLSPRPAQ